MCHNIKQTSEISVFVCVSGSRWTNEKYQYRLDEAEERRPPGSPDSAAKLSLHR